MIFCDLSCSLNSAVVKQLIPCMKGRFMTSFHKLLEKQTYRYKSSLQIILFLYFYLINLESQSQILRYSGNLSQIHLADFNPIYSIIYFCLELEPNHCVRLLYKQKSNAKKKRQVESINHFENDRMLKLEIQV